MVSKSGIDIGPYLLFVDSHICLRNLLGGDKQLHQVLWSTHKEVMNNNIHYYKENILLAKAENLLINNSTLRLIVINDIDILTRSDVVKALTHGGI